MVWLPAHSASTSLAVDDGGAKLVKVEGVGTALLIPTSVHARRRGSQPPSPRLALLQPALPGLAILPRKTADHRPTAALVPVPAACLCLLIFLDCVKAPISDLTSEHHHPFPVGIGPRLSNTHAANRPPHLRLLAPKHMRTIAQPLCCSFY